MPRCRLSKIISMSLHKLFIGLVFLLASIGLIMVASASGFQAQTSFGDSLHLFSRQLLLGFIVGTIGFFVAYSLKTEMVRKLATLSLFISIVLLVLVFIPGIGLKLGGSYRWIEVGGFSFQPSEIAKLALIFYSASWLASRKKDLPSFSQGFLPFLILSVPIPLLILAEPNISNFGISVIILFILLFVAGSRLIHLFGLGLLALVFFAAMVLLVPGRLDRVLTFLDPQNDPLGSSYQINQSLTAIGSGGLQGKGLGQGVHKRGLLPEPSGDAIFATIAEEFGFIGSTAVVLLYLIFVVVGIIIALRTQDAFSQYAVIGFVSLVALQAFINISAVSGLMPLTGVTLPFISYGSTSLASLMTASGVIAGIAKRT